MGFVVFVAWVVVAFIIAKAAKEKGRSYGGYLALGLLLSPLVSGFVLLVVGEKKDAK